MNDAQRRDFLRLGIMMALGLTGLPSSAKSWLASTSPVNSRDKTADLDIEAARAVCRGLAPIPGLADSVYDDIIAEWRRAADAGVTPLTPLLQAIIATRERFGNAIPMFSTSEFATFLATIERKDFFEPLVSTMLLAVVTLPAVWDIAGYEGESFTHGGYLLRGFNDLNWLPEPPPDVMGTLP